MLQVHLPPGVMPKKQPAYGSRNKEAMSIYTKLRSSEYQRMLRRVGSSAAHTPFAVARGGGAAGQVAHTNLRRRAPEAPRNAWAGRRMRRALGLARLRVCAWRSPEIEGKHPPALLRYYNLERNLVSELLFA